MQFKHEYRTIEQVVAAGVDFDATVGRGLITFDDWESTKHCVPMVPMLAFSFCTGEPVTTAVLELVDPDPAPAKLSVVTGQTMARKRLLEADAAEMLTSFVEDNNGQGWPVPYSNRGRRFELQFTTTGKTDTGVLMVEIWWQPLDPCAPIGCEVDG